MPSRWRWILVVAVTTALDLAARFAAPFDFARVMHVEALLFPLTAVVLGVLRRAEARPDGWPRVARLGLIWLFALGGLRPLLWTLGMPLRWANLATLVPALAGVVIWRWKVRRRRLSAEGSSRGKA